MVDQQKAGPRIEEMRGPVCLLTLSASEGITGRLQRPRVLYKPWAPARGYQVVCNGHVLFAGDLLSPRWRSGL